MESIEFIFSEFGEARKNGGGNISYLNSLDRLDPSLSSVCKFFPKSKISLYTDFNYSNPSINIIKPPKIGNENHPRNNYHNADYYKAFGLLNSTCKLSICLDSDMVFRDSRVKTLIDLIKKFKLVVPINPRNLVKNDLGTDANYNFNEDPTHGLGLSYNSTPMGLCNTSERGRLFFETFCDEMKVNPCRAPLVLWRAAWKTGIAPYVLPSQWCLCNANINPNADQFDDSIILHVGHKSVEKKFLK